MKKLLYVLIIPFIINISEAGVSTNDMLTDNQLPSPKNDIYVVAHRGVHNGIPENSLPAYQKAIDIGCDFIEIDIRTTKDGRFVSVHNSDTRDYAGASEKKIRDYTFDELRAIDIGTGYGPEWRGTKIPLLEEILQLCKHKIGIYLDLKDAPVPELVAIIRKYGMEKDILWYISASDSKAISDLQNSCPECILMPDPGPEKNLIRVTGKYPVLVVATDMEVLSEKFATTAHKNGYIVITDDKEGSVEEWKKILAMKADGIQTDRPEELIAYLKSLKT